jgi:glyoxylase-like metal-dependent hydrolase (beta-lactamase superfamily II)
VKAALRTLAALIGASVATAGLAQPGAAAPPLKVEVLRTSAGSLYANIALIEGEKKAVLVDAPFTVADAHRVVAMVLESGKELETIFVTHDHPDHFFSVEVLTQAFPNARVVAHPTVVADIWRSLPLKVKRWSPMLGHNGPRTPTAPQPLTGDVILLEGHELRVIGPMQGDHVHATALWAPEIKALFAGDLVFNQMFLWFGEHGPAERAGWAAALDRLAALKPAMVVAGHSKPGLANDASGIAFSRNYIDAWNKAAASAKDSADLRARIRRQYPQAVDVLDNFLLDNSSKVTMGEQPRWEE